MAKTSIHSEKAFEDAITNHLIEFGEYIAGNPNDFDRKLAIDKVQLINFLKTSQPELWAESEKLHKGDVEKNLIIRISSELDKRGTLDVLRKELVDLGVKYRMAFFLPENNLNPDEVANFDKNIVSVSRQVKYDENNENSLDMVLFINGLPIVSIELKNQFTGQDVDNAKKQYKFDRESTNILFQPKKRSLTHFVVDADQVYLTTQLNGSKTKFLPFNKGLNQGAGNPNNPNGYRTSYLWEEILPKKSFMDIVGRFLFYKVEEVKIGDTKKNKETLIFPRYHQLDAVRTLSLDTKTNGVGKNYLIQHSAGSGKSNTISWLAYRLSSLHNAQDKRVFEAVIVITDRKVLDKQLQDNIYQIEHKTGVVQKIDENSTQLAEALVQGTPIIITTLQKFPFVMEKVGALPNRKYAIIIDEVHGSQTGESAKKLKEVLTAKDLEEAEGEERETNEDEDAEDNIRRSMEARGKQSNLSYYGFTATPKDKTLQIFGTKNSEGDFEPFHLYSMKQAIQEGFIMDVLLNYTPYELFFKLSKSIENDPTLNKKKTVKAIGRFVSLHPHNLAQKTEIIIEHFKNIVMHKIGGKAKAMVVSSSRLHAVRYKKSFDSYIKEKGYNQIRALVAFSGKVIDNGIEETEVKMNGFKEKELPEKFHNEYQILLVADKYQTGFDEPLLHTMYVDKKLSGVKAVQTLSRLNRTTTGKEDTFILDFINDTDIIVKSFQPYYTCTLLEKGTDPNLLYDLKNLIEKAQIVWQSEVDGFNKTFYKEKATYKDQAKLNAFIDPAVERFKALPKGTEMEDESAVTNESSQANLKHAMKTFIKAYSFLAQVMPFNDIELEKFYTYLRFLVTKLPKESKEQFKLNDEVALEYYRLEKKDMMNLSLDPQEEYKLKPMDKAGQRGEWEEKERLSKIITILNDRFATDFTNADQLFFDQIETALSENEQLQKQAKNNPVENFKYGFKEAFESALIDRMEQNQDIFTKVFDDKDFGAVVMDWMLRKVYHRINGK